MTNPKKKLSKRLSDQNSFDEKDHRLACGWHVEVEGSGQRKRYLKQAKIVQNFDPASIANN
ncbi:MULTISPECIES: hypothetical protein [Prochlorococcus]|uniref:hypothetical protein n=1 Tax=Prochlorococcus TaxID=1218 RepID=UPI0005337C9E|nr:MULTISPECIES: hypothetical protein [Prochlorococcus]KGG11913.1 hypothetical protein EV05_1114 [Prochlorococcus sp. MIT 0601]